MIKPLILSLFILITSFGNVSTTYANHFLSSDESLLPSTTETTIVKDMYINNISNYLNIHDSNKFTINNKNIVYYNNNNANIYNLLTKENKLLPYTNIDQIKYIDNYLFISTNSSLVILDENLQELSIIDNDMQISINNFDIQKQNDIYSLINYNNSDISLYTFSIIEESVEILSKNSTTLTNGFIANGVSIFENKVYIASTKSNITNRITIIDTSNLSQHYFTDNNSNLLETTNIKFFNYNNNSYLATISNREKSLRVFNFSSVNNTYSLNNLTTLTTTENFEHLEIGAFLNFNDFTIISDKIYVLDSITKSVQEVLITTTANQIVLSPSNIIIASSSYELGRFYNPLNISSKKENMIYIADTENNRIQIINNEISTSITELNTIDSKIAIIQPMYIEKDSNNNNIVLIKHNNLHEFFVYDDENNIIANINSVLVDNTEIALAQVISTTTTNNNDIFAIIYLNNNYHIIKSENYNTFEIIELNGIVLNSEYKIKNFIDDLVLYNNNNKVYIINNKEIKAIDLTNIINDELIIETTTDLQKNIILLTTKNIISINTEDFSTTTVNLSENNLSNITNITVATDSGTLYLFNNDKQQLISLTNSELSNGFKDFVHSINPEANNAFDKLLNFATTTKSTYLYEYPNFAGDYLKIEENTKVIILSNETNFVQVLVKNENVMQSGYLYIDNIEIQTTPAYNNETTFKTINKYVKIYKYPSIYGQSDKKAIILHEYGLNTEINPLSEEILGFDNNTYYAVEYENGKIGYINKANIIPTNYSSIKPLLKTNYKTQGIENEIIVYINADSESEIVYSLKSNHKIFVETFDENTEYTFIKFLDSNNNELSGYIKTVNINPGINHEKTLTAILLSVLGITLLATTVLTYKHLSNKKNKD